MAAKQVEVTGDLSLTVDDPPLEASVTFTKGAGRSWTVAGLLDLMKQRGIVEGFKEEEVRRLFNLIPDKASPYTFIVAKGVAPAHARPETVTWEMAVIPPDLQGQAEAALRAAKPPEISVERRKHIKQKKKFTVKPKLPFLKPKEEIREVNQEEVTVERIYIDPTVERTGYALAGEKLGTVEAAIDGEAGRSITGETVPAKVVADPAFYAGPGVVRRQDELFAEHDGFVRVGTNWVDIVGFETHSWDLSLSDDSVTCFLSFDPGDPRAAPPTAEHIREKAAELGYDIERLIPDDEITALVHGAVSTREQMVKVPLTASRDAGFDIFVSEDRLKAVLNVSKGTGRGARLDYRALGKAIKESKLIGLNFDQIKQDLAAFHRGPELQLVGYVLAEGTPPEPGPARTVDWSVRFLPADETADLTRHFGQVLEDSLGKESMETFPLAIIENIGEVEAEQRLVTISPPVPGKPGKDVFGQQIASEPAPEPKVVTLENIEKKGNVLIATTRGLLLSGWKDGVAHARVVEHQDGGVRIRLSPAKMSALISMTPARGTGRPVTWEQVEAAVTEAGIAKGVNEELLHKAHERAAEGSAIADLIFARGTHATGGTEGEVEMLVELASGKDVTFRGDGSADFRTKDRITTVVAGARLARIHPPESESQDGWDVTGETLTAKARESVTVEAGANVSVVEEDGGTRLLVADIDGELLQSGNTFEVRAGHFVDGDVDLASGNVKFPGTVTIKGSVRSGFYVVATGDIQVGELVEAALLSADGDIVVNQGIKGAGKAVIRTKKSAGMLFAEHATILAVGNVQVKNSLVHCVVKTNGKLRMIGDKCTILGGEIRCRSGLETRNLGSERGVRTHIAFGQNFLIADQIEREEKEMEKIKKEVAQIDFSIRDKERAHDKAQLDALHGKKLTLLKILEKRGLRVFTLRERFEEHQESAIVVTGSVYPGIVLESHGRTLEIASEKKNVTFAFNPETGRIEERTADAAPPQEAGASDTVGASPPATRGKQ